MGASKPQSAPVEPYTGALISKVEAVRQKLTRYFTGVPCGNGHIAQRMVSDGHCCACEKLRRSWGNLSESKKERWREKNRAANLSPAKLQRRRAKDRAKYERTKDQYREEWRRWHANNRAKWNATVAGEKEGRKRATPAWADLKAIEAFYADAVRLTKETGIEHEVDHIVPMKSKLVCGLHVEHNLRVITQAENGSKSNLHWPDMW